LISEVDLTMEGWWNFSKLSVANGLVYLTHTISEPAPPVVVYDPNREEWQTNQPPEWVWVQRTFLDVIDYADASEPVVRRPIETSGKLAGVSSNGALIDTVGARWRPHNDWSNDASEWLDVSAYDGVALHLVDSLRLPTEWPRPLLVDQDVVLLGRVMSNDGGTSAIETWSLGTDGKLSLIADLEPAGAAQVLVNLGGILAAQTNDGVLLFDWTDPSQLRPLGGGVLPGCFWPDLRHAVGDPSRGIWMPLGYNGVWRLPIVSTF
jgi:hypothetical protein